MILTVTLNAAIDKRYVVDAFKAGEVNRVKECSYVPGGKGLNVSKPASIYGAEVVATGFVGARLHSYRRRFSGICKEIQRISEERRCCFYVRKRSKRPEWNRIPETGQNCEGSWKASDP